MAGVVWFFVMVVGFVSVVLGFVNHDGGSWADVLSATVLVGLVFGLALVGQLVDAVKRRPR